MLFVDLIVIVVCMVLVFSKRILIIFAPEEAEIFQDYLFILA
jgi:hypothetical protein